MNANDQIIYLDNNSSTRIDPAVLDEMMPFLTTRYGNPSSAHGFGAQVKEATKLAHERVAALLGCEPNEIVFTSGGTESDNTALHSALQMTPDRRHIVTTSSGAQRRPELLRGTRQARLRGNGRRSR